MPQNSIRSSPLIELMLDKNDRQKNTADLYDLWHSMPIDNRLMFLSPETTQKYGTNLSVIMNSMLNHMADDDEDTYYKPNY